MTNQDPSFQQEASTFVLDKKMRPLFFGVLLLLIICLSAILIDFIYHLIKFDEFRDAFSQLIHIYQSRLETSNRHMAESTTAKFGLVKASNWFIIALLFILNRARPLATFNNFFGMQIIFFGLVLLNTFISIFYRTSFLANGFWYAVLAFPFIALPIHEYQKLKKRTPNLIPTDSFLYRVMN